MIPTERLAAALLVHALPVPLIGGVHDVARVAVALLGGVVRAAGRREVEQQRGEAGEEARRLCERLRTDVMTTKEGLEERTEVRWSETARESPCQD